MEELTNTASEVLPQNEPKEQGGYAERLLDFTPELILALFVGFALALFRESLVGRRESSKRITRERDAFRTAVIAVMAQLDPALSDDVEDIYVNTLTDLRQAVLRFHDYARDPDALYRDWKAYQDTKQHGFGGLNDAMNTTPFDDGTSIAPMARDRLLTHLSALKKHGV